MKLKSIFRALIFMVVAATPKALFACAVCMGGPDSTVTPAINGAIFFMLATVGAVLASFGGFIFYLSRRANASIPPHVDLIAAENYDQ